VIELNLIPNKCPICNDEDQEQCPNCSNPWPKKGAQYDVLFAVDRKGNGWLIDVDAEVAFYMDEACFGANMEDGGFVGVPDEPGVYRAKAKFVVYSCGSFGEEETTADFNLSGIALVYPPAEAA
jgi:hypothetical protein